FNVPDRGHKVLPGHVSDSLSIRHTDGNSSRILINTAQVVIAAWSDNHDFPKRLRHIHFSISYCSLDALRARPTTAERAGIDVKFIPLLSQSATKILKLDPRSLIV